MLACEVGGRFSEECINFVRFLSQHKASLQPPVLQKSYQLAYDRRWWSILSIAVQRAVGMNLLGKNSDPASLFPQPEIEELFAGCIESGDQSRMR